MYVAYKIQYRCMSCTILKVKDVTSAVSDKKHYVKSVKSTFTVIIEIKQKKKGFTKLDSNLTKWHKNIQFFSKN